MGWEAPARLWGWLGTGWLGCGPCVPKGRRGWAWASGSRQPGHKALRPSLVDHGAGAVRDPGACHVTWVKGCENTAPSGENDPFSLQSAFPGTLNFPVSVSRRRCMD